MGNQNWRDEFSFLDNDAVEHPVGGKSFKFHPVSAMMAFKMRGLAKPVVSALMTLMSDTSGQDVKIVERTIQSEATAESGAAVSREIITESMSPELAAERFRQRETSVGQLVDAIMADDARDALGEMVMDSLRDVFPPDKRNTWPPVKEFFITVPITALPDFLVGLAKANKGVLGPLERGLGLSFKKVEQTLREKMEGKTGSPNASNSSNQTPSVPG